MGILTAQRWNRLQEFRYLAVGDAAENVSVTLLSRLVRIYCLAELQHADNPCAINELAAMP